MDKEEMNEPLLEEAKPEPPKPKAKRQPTAYNAFVKDNFSKVKDLPTKDRFKKIAEMWAEHKSKPAKKKRKKKE
jgi:hypothetical protein